jgi:hypothetical protein
MTKIIRIIFVFAALSILAGDSFKYILTKNTTVIVFNEKDVEDTDKENSQEKEDDSETKKGKDDFKEDNDKEKDKHRAYDFFLKSKLYSFQYTIFLYTLNYTNRSRELESPPPEA